MSRHVTRHASLLSSKTSFFFVFFPPGLSAASSLLISSCLPRDSSSTAGSEFGYSKPIEQFRLLRKLGIENGQD